MQGHAGRLHHRLEVPAWCTRTPGHRTHHRRHLLRASNQWTACAQAHQLDGLQIRIASDAAELRAAAYLRAASFHVFNPDRSEFAQRAHKRMKADTQWQELEDKLSQTLPGWKGIKVLPLLALIPNDPASDVCQAVLTSMEDLSSQVPPEEEGGAAWVPVASLDVSIGKTLPAEELVGKLPEEGASTGRAYVSNVCVAHGARRQGLARQLMDHAEALAGGRGVEHLYVHVEVVNEAAVTLYKSCGFQVESEESADAARKRQHNRRLLLRKRLAAS